MKNTLITIIITLVVAFACFKLSNTTNGSHAEEPQSAVTDTVKADTVSFEERIKLAIEARNELSSHRYKNWDEFYKNEQVDGFLSYEDESGTSWVLDIRSEITQITAHKNGMPEFIVSWDNNCVDGTICRANLIYMDENGNEVAFYNRSNNGRWFCHKTTSNTTKVHKYSGGSVKLHGGYTLIVSDPRICLNIK